MTTFEKSLYMEHLATVPMFSACSPTELGHIADRATMKTAPDGTSMVVEGESGEEFFVIASGKAKVMRQGQQVAELGVGNFFGELALFDDAPRNASVVADGLASAIVISRRDFNDLLGEIGSMRDSLLRGMAHRIHQLDAHV